MTATSNNTDRTLNRLILHVDDPDIDTRDQFADEDTGPNLTPGWNALTVIDVIKGAFLLEASSHADEYPDPYPELTDGELDQILPGLTARVKEAVGNNIASDALHRALQEETKDLARRFMETMSGQDRQHLLNSIKAKFAGAGSE